MQHDEIRHGQTREAKKRRQQQLPKQQNDAMATLPGICLLANFSKLWNPSVLFICETAAESILLQVWNVAL